MKKIVIISHTFTYLHSYGADVSKTWKKNEKKFINPDILRILQTRLHSKPTSGVNFKFN